MSDEQTLLAVIAAIYLADCIYWIPRQGVSFTRWLGKFWEPIAPSTTLGNERGAIGFANPLPPLGLATRAVGWTISISAQGVFSYISAAFNSGGSRPQKAVFIAWSQIQKVEREDKRILINGALFATAVSEYSARWMAQEIARLQKVSNNKRSAEIEATIAASCAPDGVKTRVETFEKQTKVLRYLANWLFLFLFAACPYLVMKIGIVRALWPIVFGIYAQTIVIALLFSYLHRKIYPTDSGQIFKPFLTMILAAPSAIRAQDILGRPLLERFHPLAVARALCASDQFDQLASIVFRDLHFPRIPIIPPGSSESAAATEKAFRDTLLKSLRRLDSLDESKILQPPQKSESVHASYCPRCLQQFTAAATNCPDCGGRPLVKF
jgi:hypothetical protein